MRASRIKNMLDPLPRVALCGAWPVGLGRTKRMPWFAADLAEAAIAAITGCGGPRPVPKIHFRRPTCRPWNTWSLEQAKLGQTPEKRSPARSPAITGAAAPSDCRRQSLCDAGAEVALLDLDETAIAAKGKAVGGAALAVRCDVTSPASVAAGVPTRSPRISAASTSCVQRGAAWQGRIGEVDEEVLRKSFELNFYGHQRVAQAAVGSCWRREPAAASCSMCRSRRSIRARISDPMGLTEGRDALSGAPNCARLRRRRHPVPMR